MLIRTVRKPGDPGTLKLMQRYGDRLVTVRYRYDPARGKRFKTVELIVEEQDWAPAPQAEPAQPTAPPQPQARYTPRVPVRIRYNEKDLQRAIKAIGGNWDSGKKLWYAPEEYVRRIGLANRIVR